jgi:hypothetical protein
LRCLMRNSLRRLLRNLWNKSLRSKVVKEVTRADQSVCRARLLICEGHVHWTRLREVRWWKGANLLILNNWIASTKAGGQSMKSELDGLPKLLKVKTVG